MHRSHDFRHLAARWLALSRRAGLRLRREPVGKYPLYWLRTPALRKSGGIYLSAGIHGDEPGSTEGLLAWAEANVDALRGLPLLILPCLNPWGLVNNIRLNETGLDLNRSFHREDLPFVQAWRRIVGDLHFSTALLLHEDYDGEGIYLYELNRNATWGESLLQAAKPFLPIEGRTKLDTFQATSGVIQRRLRNAWFKARGYPEAVWLNQGHGCRAFTIETPSEFDINARAAAHRAVVEAAVQMTIG